MPCAESVYKARKIWEGSASGSGDWPWCCSQYCMTMAMLAAPHPFFCCWTNGTSSHSAARPGAAVAAHIERVTTAATPASLNSISEPSMDCDDDEDERCDANQNDEQIAIAHVSC